MNVTPGMKVGFLERPQRTLTRGADIKKGGGFEYVGGFMPVEIYPACFKAGVEISSRHNIAYTVGGRIIGRSHSMMFYLSFAFNRADPGYRMPAPEALSETDECVLRLGGAIWKPTVHGQKLIMEKMDQNTLDLMTKIKGLLDPNKIMNPGNWEAQ